MRSRPCSRSFQTRVLLIVKILHITFAAAWFGHKILIPRDLRQSIHMARAERLGILSGFGTLATGFWLVSLTTGFSETPLRIWLGLAAVLAMFLVGGLVGRPAWRDVKAGLADNDLPRAVSRVGALIGALRLEGLLWVLALTTMLL